MIAVPQHMAESLIHTFGATGRRWIHQLPERVDHLCRRWGLQVVEGRAPRGDWNLILYVLRDGMPCVLKIFGPEPSAKDEVEALMAWDGRGAVHLLEVDPDEQGVLLEQLDPTLSLADVDLMRAAEVAGTLIRRLAVLAPPELPLLVDIAQNHAETSRFRQRAQGDPLPTRWIDLATTLARQLASDTGNSLVHGDLHYGNILAGTREPWLAIDPKPVAGNPERSVAELMWTRLDDARNADAVHALFATLVRAGGLDPDRSWAWVVVQTVHYWLWALDVGLTEDPVRCHRLLDALT